MISVALAALLLGDIRQRNRPPQMVRTVRETGDLGRKIPDFLAAGRDRNRRLRRRAEQSLGVVDDGVDWLPVAARQRREEGRRRGVEIPNVAVRIDDYHPFAALFDGGVAGDRDDIEQVQLHRPRRRNAEDHQSDGCVVQSRNRRAAEHRDEVDEQRGGPAHGDEHYRRGVVPTPQMEGHECVHAKGEVDVRQSDVEGVQWPQSGVNVVGEHGPRQFDIGPEQPVYRVRQQADGEK